MPGLWESGGAAGKEPGGRQDIHLSSAFRMTPGSSGDASGGGSPATSLRKTAGSVWLCYLAGAASAGQGKGDDDYVHREEILKQQDENRQEVPGR